MSRPGGSPQWFTEQASVSRGRPDQGQKHLDCRSLSGTVTKHLSSLECDVSSEGDDPQSAPVWHLSVFGSEAVGRTVVRWGDCALDAGPVVMSVRALAWTRGPKHQLISFLHILSVAVLWQFLVAALPDHLGLVPECRTMPDTKHHVGVSGHVHQSILVDCLTVSRILP